MLTDFIRPEVIELSGLLTKALVLSLQESLDGAHCCFHSNVVARNGRLSAGSFAAEPILNQADGFLFRCGQGQDALLVEVVAVLRMARSRNLRLSVLGRSSMSVAQPTSMASLWNASMFSFTR